MPQMEPWQIGKQLDNLGEQIAKAGEQFAQGKASEGNSACDDICRTYDDILAMLDSVKLERKDREEFRQYAHYGTACARSVQGRKQEALDALARALDAGFENVQHIRGDSDLAGIRDEPRFEELIASIGKGKEQQKADKERIESIQAKGVDVLTEAARLFGEGGDAAKATALADEAISIYESMVAELVPIKMRAAAKAEYRQHAYYNTACARAMQGKAQDAIDAFERLMAAGYDIWIQVQKDPDFARIKEEPRFKNILSLAKATKEIYDFYFDELRKQRVLFEWDLSVPTLDGSTVSLSDLLGKVVIATVFTTQEPLWEAQAAVYSGLKSAFDGRLEIVGLAWESDEGAVKAEVEKGTVTYPVAMVKDRAVLEAIPDFTGLGTSLFIDKAGRVRFRAGGRVDPPILWIVGRLLDVEDV